MFVNLDISFSLAICKSLELFSFAFLASSALRCCIAFAAAEISPLVNASAIVILDDSLSAISSLISDIV